MQRNYRSDTHLASACGLATALTTGLTTAELHEESRYVASVEWPLKAR